MIFYKTVAAGNDFIHVNKDELNVGLNCCNAINVQSALALRLCERQTGAGADGVVFYRVNPEWVDFEIYNRDGGEAELSGNGMAGVSALLFYLNRWKEEEPIVLHTKAGVKTHRCLRRKDNVFRLRIEIGDPHFQDTRFFPFLKPGEREYRYRDIAFYPVSVGNPHAVVRLNKNYSDDELEAMGKMLEGAEIFPFRANIEFVVPTTNQDIRAVDFAEGENFRIFFYERGVGPTLASSTGSAAVYAVLRQLALTNGSLVIPANHSEKGDKEDTDRWDERIKVTGDSTIFLENTTTIIYKGDYLDFKSSRKSGDLGFL
ncbi:MAG: diaminopimelate epimerase [Candidatus Omnitrophota bacterium]